MQHTKTAILILAAGASTRMGTPKQLLIWEDSTLLKNAIKQSTALVSEDTYVVLGANFEVLKNHIEGCSAHIIQHSHWASGLGSSIACGVKQLMHGNYNRVLIMLADQPLITSTYLRQLLHVSTTSNQTIIASQFNHILSVPAVFDKKHFTELTHLNADYGAKKLFYKHRKALKKIILAQNILKDIDTPEDYASLREIMF